MSVSLSGGVHSVYGTAAGETIQVSESAGTLSVTDGTSTQTFPTSNVSAVYVDAGAGNDTVRLTGVTKPAEAYGGEGDDQLFGGLANDLLDGGAGSDLLRGDAGNLRRAGQRLARRQLGG